MIQGVLCPLITHMIQGVLCPLIGGRCGRGALSCTTGVRMYYHLENLDILHKKLCIYVHICMILDT